jgi:methyl-accepting chemotaxis protein
MAARLRGATVLNTMRGRLLLGSIAVLLAIAAATWLGIATVGQLSREMDGRLEALRASLALANELETRVLDQIAVGQWYLVSRDGNARRQFQDQGWRAHDVRRQYGELDHLTGVELAQVESTEALHSRLEVDFALAHAMVDLGEPEAARDRVAAALPVLDELRSTLQRLSSNEAAKVAVANAELRDLARRRQLWLILATLAAIVLGVGVLTVTIRGLNRPMDQLVIAAGRLGEGDLSVELERGRMLREFDALAAAFNQMAGHLRRIVSATMETADRISVSASDLSSISEEVAASSGEVATAMVEITTGAEGQARGLRTTEEALEEMGRRAKEISEATESVTELSGQIHDLAASTRAQVTPALERLLEVRQVVTNSADQVRELEQTSTQIDKFVETISGLARQTNLLALNAAIEAARAGEHGRGFSVVADEVRKLAEASGKAADEVAESVSRIRGRIGRVVNTMQEGTEKVAGVEQVARDTDSALQQVITAIDSVRLASDRVSGAVARNQEAMVGVEESLTDVLGTAESHAASAQEVSAAAEEQSAATEELSASSSELLASAERMKGLVSEFST